MKNQSDLRTSIIKEGYALKLGAGDGGFLCSKTINRRAFAEDEEFAFVFPSEEMAKEYLESSLLKEHQQHIQAVPIHYKTGDRTD